MTGFGLYDGSAMNIFQEYKDEIKRLQLERNILREIAIVEIQKRWGWPREEIEQHLNAEILEKMQGREDHE